MRKEDLVREAIAHKACAGIPFSVVLTAEAYKKYGEKLLADYPDERVCEDLAKGRLRFEQAVSLAIGNSLVYITPPWWSWHNLSEAFLHGEDTPETLPDSIGQGDYEAFFAQSQWIAQRYDVYQLAVIWGSHWEKAYFCRGIENFLYDLANDPAWAQSLLDHIIDKNMVMLQNILACGTFAGVLLGSDWGTQRSMILSPRMWREMIAPGEKREYDLLKRYHKDVWIHSCGYVVDILPDLCALGVDVLNPVQPECMDLDRLKADYGQKLCYYGGISTQRVLPFGTPKEVVRETEETIRRMAAGGGYITAPSQEIQEDVPYENLRALLDAARAHAGLPAGR